ncbi:Cysteine proteinase inhibitor 12, partial [Mucuna pruriens]
MAAPQPGAIFDVPDAPDNVKIQNLARFAVDQYNKKENSSLEYVRVISAKEQVIAGFKYYITLEAKDDGIKKVYEATVLENVSYLRPKIVLYLCME